MPTSAQMPIRPLLNPVLRRVWRDTTTLQIGLDPERAVVIAGVDPACARLLEAMDGTQDAEGLLRRADALGVDPQRAGRLLDLLADGGVLLDAATDVRPLAVLDRVDRDRLAPDLAAAGLARGGDVGAEVLARRRRTSVTVCPLGRVGAELALLLGAAGLGRVVPVDRAPLEAADLPGAGIDRSALGQRREDAVREALARVAPATRTAAPRRRLQPDVVVLTDAAAAAEHVEDLLRHGVAHLHVAVRETTGIVGPFVVPGRTSCLRCQDLHRRDRDPGWPRIAAQLSGGHRGGGQPTHACDTVLAAAVAAQAALQVLQWVDDDGARLPVTADAAWEIRLPDGAARRRRWSLHPSCGCQWPRAG